MRKKATIPMPAGLAEPYLMGIADQLADDPMLCRLIGPRFMVIVDYNAAARRVTYSFRSPDDRDPADDDAVAV